MLKVQLNNLSKVYQNKNDGCLVTALERLSFSVESGEIAVLIGPSGCGKTTILNLIAGFTYPTRGEVLFNGNPISVPGADRTMIFQECALFPWYSVRNNIKFGLDSKSLSKAKKRQLVGELLFLVGLEKFADFYPHQLSGGMKQRAALARALAVDPEVLLMDEPFGSLDAQARGFLQQSLLEIWRIKKPTIVFVTHSIDEALTLGHKILVLSRQPAKVLDCVKINKPFPRDIVRDSFFQSVLVRIDNVLKDEFREIPTRDRL